MEWDPPGEHLFYSHFGPGPADSLFRVRADGSGAPEFLASDVEGSPAGWVADGGELFYVEWPTYTLRAVELESGQARTLLDEPAPIGWPALSPDGDWLVYGVLSDVGEIVVRSFPALENRRVVARGASPAWTKGGSELLFVREDDDGGVSVFALGFDPANGRAVGEPVELFSRDDFGFTQPFRAFDVSADGEHILGILGTPPEAPPEPEIHLVLNWFEELREGAGGR